MKKLFLFSCLFFIFTTTFAQAKKKTTTPKAVTDCLVNAVYCDTYCYKFYSNGTGVVGQSPSFTWKYLGNNIVLVKYNSDFFNDDKFRIVNLGKRNCDIVRMN